MVVGDLWTYDQERARLTYEELLTVLVEVECILNSSPLTYMYPDEIGNCLISGRQVLSLLDTTKGEVDNPSSSQETVSRRASYLQTLMDHFWKFWRRKYVPALRESYWLKEVRPGPVVRKADVVSIHEQSLPRTLCRTGVVHELIKGIDTKTWGAVVRVANKGKISFLRRSVQRLFQLEIISTRSVRAALKIQQVQSTIRV